MSLIQASSGIAGSGSNCIPAPLALAGTGKGHRIHETAHRHDSGYEIGVGGAAGMDLKEVERLAKVATEQEAIDLTVAFVQLYREHAKYLDRPYKWLAKVGLEWVRAQVVDDLENRTALIARFDLSQSIYQRDPWADRATPRAQAEFAPLADLTREAAE